ncbi:MAG: exonuclease domain-containing protein [Clostridiales bacterium]|nr:exonuclease domain-containing protein [Clostridiales bacterium]
MKNYIVFDLEWNQCARGKAESIEDFPFEIIEIGAVRLDEQCRVADEFHKLIRPREYTTMHYMISEVTHMKMKELRHDGERFEDAVRAFFDWCGEDCVFCTWGSMDLTELQRNLKHFQVPNPFPRPLFYYDVQKLYGLCYKDGAKPSLDGAVEELGLLEERPFHRALDDAYYTGRVLARMYEEQDWERLLSYCSIDYYRLPETKEEEISIVFPNYSKYVSRIFPNREAALQERTVTKMNCYVCGRSLRKKVRWFSPNQRIYYALAVCPEHGFLKGKLRVKKVDEERVYIIKTLKLTDEEGMAKISSRLEDLRIRRAERNRAKRRRSRHGDGEQK